MRRGDPSTPPGRPPGDAAGREVTAAELEAVAAAVAAAAGLSLAAGLGPALREALRAAAAARGEPAAALAGRVIAGDGGAVAAVVERAAVGETAFFRHPEQLAALGRRLGGADGPLRLWSAGCATGDEAYSLAILLLEAGRAARGDLVIATDLSARALAAARAGAYPPRALRHLPAGAGRWLHRPDAAGARRVRPEVRGLVAFARHNLLHDPAPPEAPFDAILCRNVLMYFDRAVAEGVLRRLAAALRPGGLLLLSPVEQGLAAAAPLEAVDDGGVTLLRRPARRA